MSVERALLVWDGECGLCRRSVAHLHALVGNRIASEPYQTAAAHVPDVPSEAFREAVHLVEPDGHVTRGGEAVFRALWLGGRRRWLYGAYRGVPGFASLSEGAYRFVAGHRPALARWVDRLVGDLVGPPRYQLTRWLFLRGLALVYLAAFLSLGVQIHGLVGESGLLPAQPYMEAVRQVAGWTDVPTLGWLAAGNAMLSGLWIGGALASLLVLAGVAQGPALLACYVAYLSLYHLGQEFLGFQWDILLLETGVLALLLAPWRLRPARPEDEPAVSPAAIWMLRLLLCKLMFSSGLTKLTWHDPTWADLTALTYHYWTQPIPAPLAWLADLLPVFVQKLSCLLMYVVELGLPVLALGPRRLRVVAFAGFVALQLGIGLTGNYGFFSLLSIVLCVVLLDDAQWPGLLRGLARGRGPVPTPPAWRSLATAPLIGAYLLLSVIPWTDALNTGYWYARPHNPLVRLQRLAQPFALDNDYGLFRTMTTRRPELNIEGTGDGRTWTPYAFRYKPGDPARAPHWFVPHMPRLDWQMWFAALHAEAGFEQGGPRGAAGMLERWDPWLPRLLGQLLRGEGAGRLLLADDPFAAKPLEAVRVVLWRYRFHHGSGDWWERERVGVVIEIESGGDQ